jgi:hypothetical protein
LHFDFIRDAGKTEGLLQTSSRKVGFREDNSAAIRE